MPEIPDDRFFEVLGYRVLSEKDVDNKRARVAEAKIKVKIAGVVQLFVENGDGPVNALDNALRKALTPMFPVLDNVHLFDYWVRTRNGGRATAAEVEVLVFTTYDGVAEPLITKGVSTDIIEASLVALIKSFKLIIGKTLDLVEP